MVLNRVKPIVASVMLASLSIPVTSSAQVSRYAAYDQPSVVVECGPGQRAVLEHRGTGDGTQLVARCVGVTSRVAARSTVRTAPRRTKTKTALMIAGSSATGAGVGGALKGKKGALIGAAVGGGSATIYEAIKRR